MMALLSGLWGRVAGWAIAVGGVLAILAAAYSKGKAAERAAQTTRDFEAMTEGQKIDEAVAGNAPDENRKELKKWSR